MKLSLSFLTTALLVPFSEAIDLQARWNIENVTATNDDNAFTFSYSGTSKSWLTNSDTGTPTDVKEKVQITMYDFDCKPTTASVNANEATYGQIGIVDTTADEFVMDSLGYGSEGSGPDLEFKFTTVPKNMAKNNKITGLTVNDKSDMKFCVRIGLIAVDDSDSTKNNEINFQETEVTLSVTMSGGFDITSFAVAPKAKTSDAAAQTYQVNAKLCDDAQQAPKDGGGKFNQGAAIRVCITPDDKAIVDGVVMTTVDSFKWTRTYSNDASGAAVAPTVQDAVVINEGVSILSNDGLSLYGDADKANAEQPQIVITSVLFAKFYETDGTVSADGSATMAFPTGPAAAAGTARRLGNSDNKRNLQDGGTAAAPFEMTATLNKADDGPAALQQTAGGTGTSITVVATIVGLVSAILLA